MLLQGNSQGNGLKRGIQGRRRYIRRPADTAGINLQQQLGHGGVACHRDGGDIFNIHPRFNDHFFNQLVHNTDHDFMKLFESSRLFGVHNPADDILAITDLSVEIPELRQHLSGDQVYQLAIDGRSADIHGNRVIAACRVAGLHIDNMGFPARMYGPDQRRRYFEV